MFIKETETVSKPSKVSQMTQPRYVPRNDIGMNNASRMWTCLALTVSQIILNSTCWPAMKISVKRETATYAPTLKLSCLSSSLLFI